MAKPIDIAQQKSDPWEANARLMSAAPELYEALVDALAGLRYVREHYHDERTATGDLYGVGFDRVEAKALAAIAKAFGQKLPGTAPGICAESTTPATER